MASRKQEIRKKIKKQNAKLGLDIEASKNIVDLQDQQGDNIHVEDFEKIPQLNCRNTKEFRAIINGNIEKPSSVLEFNWISYTQKALKQISVPNSSTKVPSFVDNMQY